ncbi:MAG: hypothetical protein AAGH15_16235 [Myxococcota bacterium]
MAAAPAEPMARPRRDGRALRGSDYLWFQPPLPGSADDSLLLVFSNIQVPAGRFAGRRALAQHPGAVLYLNCPDNAWFLQGIPGLGHDLASTAEALRQLVAELAPSRLVAFGDSMGGSGALVFGDALGADVVVALSPELELTQAGSYFLKHAPDGALAADWPAWPGSRRAERVIAVFGDCDAGEMRQALALSERRPDAELSFVPGLFHHVLPVLDRWVGLGPWLQAVLEGEAPPRCMARDLGADAEAIHAAHAAWHAPLCAAEAGALIPAVSAAFLAETASPLRRAHLGDTLGRLLELGGLEEAATAWLEKLSLEHPGYLPIYNRLLGRLPASHREPARVRAEAAVEALDPALPGQAVWRDEAVRTLRRISATRAAERMPPRASLRAIDRALTIHPGNFHLLYDRGVLLERMGDLAGAEASYEASAVAKPGTAAERSLQRLRAQRQAQRNPSMNPPAPPSRPAPSAQPSRPGRLAGSLTPRPLVARPAATPTKPSRS